MNNVTNRIAAYDDDGIKHTERDGVYLLALVKGAERYVFLYDEGSRAELLRHLGRCAGNAELSFNWYDAAALSQRVRRSAPEESAT